MDKIEFYAKAMMIKHGLNPIEELRYSHHTDTKFTEEDKEIGELAYYLGCLFVDKNDNINESTPIRDTYYFNEMTSLDIWMRVARALRIHGLKITNIENLDK